MTVALDTTQLVKIYGGVAVVDHLDLVVNHGELVGLLGPNGAGKTTTIRMLCTVLAPDGGTAAVLGLDVQREKAGVRSLIGVAPQEHALYDLLTARENLAFMAAMHGIPPVEAHERADELLGKLGLAGRKDRVKNFSGGMKRRLDLAMATVMDPEVIFLDEPTAGLDPQARHVVWDFIRELKAKGKAILLTTHDMLEADELSDRVVIIDHGKVIAEGTPQALKERHGEGSVAELRCKHPDDVKTLRERVAKLDFVTFTHANGDTVLSINFSGGVMNFAKLLNQGLGGDLSLVESLSLRQASLEDVFLRLTGRRLRE
ncbi:MAG: ATP-binding cassette domain-containing protein [Candidatus Lokiarchaeota archaeon]|nr:ATP-binding cassette domain-containing protein [Candidatus Lokiarchaeota archaeon]